MKTEERRELECGCTLVYDEAKAGNPDLWDSWTWDSYGRECNHVHMAQVHYDLCNQKGVA